ncbi:MAG: sigma-70 family RNA polymerase sigma factor [Planctomycetota bacterium]|nr:sigma-70 family RNA polymerase sigma factor [Planctomycetota bacterium]
MALSEIDRNLLARCVSKKPKAWEDFVDRYMGLVIHVINHSALCRSIRLTNEDREDLASEVFYELVRDDFAVLRHFRAESSLATYLTVVTRRIVVHQLLRNKNPSALSDNADAAQDAVDGRSGGHAGNGHDPSATDRIETRDEVERLLEELEGTEAQIVRMYHLEGKSYQEISSTMGMPENSIGPTLSRARQKLRKVAAE